jgi:predicted GNAT family acetyltransferase
MRVQRLTDVSRFYELVEPVLMEREAENNFELGLARRLCDEPPHPEHFYATVEDDDGRVHVAAMMTPPWPLALSRGPNAAMDALAQFVHEQQVPVSEVSGPVTSARRCAATVAALQNKSVQTRTMMRIMQLQRVIPPRPATGAMRIATVADIELIVEWMAAFSRDVGETHEIPRKRIEQRVANGEHFLWEDPAPVSTAAWAGPTPNGVRINAVYTPPECRGRGYASTCVAQLTQRMLDGGKKFCFLYTDAANPTSNKIYQQIGYEFVCDWVKLQLASDYRERIKRQPAAARTAAGRSGRSQAVRRAAPGR